MITIPVVWLNYHEPEVLTRGMWDQGMLELLLSRQLWPAAPFFTFTHSNVLPGEGGAVVVVPGRYHVEDVDRINAELAPLDWVLLIITSDEESLFPHRALTHPYMDLWIMTPRVGQHGAGEASRFLGEGFAPWFPRLAREAADGAQDRPLDWFFAGQVTHERRHDLVASLQQLRLHEDTHGELLATPGFTQGLEPYEYAEHLVRTKVAPAPSGPATQDSFRAFEALEAGCAVVLDGVRPGNQGAGYWDLLLGADHPFPVLDDWADSPGVMRDMIEAWPSSANRHFAWWQAYKRRLALDLVRDIARLSGLRPRRSLSESITVVIPTSPIPSHPDTWVIEETVRSIRAQPALTNVEIIVAIDGLRPEQQEMKPAYDEYRRRLLWLCNHRWQALPLYSDWHVHQGGLMRMALRQIHTPLTLFVEHDTPLCEEIPWFQMAQVLQSGALHVIRLHHEALVLEPHQHLMLDKEPITMKGIPLLRTAQWSQRPHLARTGFYNRIIGEYFGDDSRTMIEDVMHGVVDQAWREKGEAGWNDFRLALYAPPGDMKRSLHTDGRAEQPMYPNIFGYDGRPTPEGAPRATAERVD